MQVIPRVALDELIAELRRRGYTPLGPTVRDGAIVLDELGSGAELPIGWGDQQEGGAYRLRRRGDRAAFGFAVGPHSWKRVLHPPEVRLWRARRDGEDGSVEIEEEAVEAPRYAFVGVRSCDLAAIAVQDRVLLEGSFPDPHYAARREGALIVAVNCADPAGTCFCASMQTGPRARSGYDLALTELLDGEHRFTVEVGSEAGAELLAGLAHDEAGAEDERASLAVSEQAAERMGRELDTDGLRELLQRNLEHPRWDEVSERCLTCGNCTMVCPTCFCTTVTDHTDLAGAEAERRREWDSCFSLDFSYVHGGSVRNSPRSRYRQWMTHKLSTWFDQFGSSGCIGCGRCITWCPVAIDITEEAAAIRATDREVR